MEYELQYVDSMIRGYHVDVYENLMEESQFRPFVYALSALVTGKVDDNYTQQSREELTNLVI